MIISNILEQHNNNLCSKIILSAKYTRSGHSLLSRKTWLHLQKLALNEQAVPKHNEWTVFPLPSSPLPDLMETFKPCQIHRSFSNSHYYAIQRKGVIASVVGCGIFNRVLKASLTQITNVGRLHNSRVIFVMGSVFLFFFCFPPFCVG